MSEEFNIDPVDPIPDALDEIAHLATMLGSTVLVLQRRGCAPDTAVMCLDELEEIVETLDRVHSNLVFGLGMIEKAGS